MRKGQVMRMILMPQGVKFMLPAIISQCVIVLKDTSLGYIILYSEAVRYAEAGGADSSPDGSILIYSSVALVFIVINYSLSKLAQSSSVDCRRRGAEHARRSGSEAGCESQASRTTCSEVCQTRAMKPSRS